MSKLIRFRTQQRQKLVHVLQEKIGRSGKAIRRLLESNACKINGRFERFGSVWVEKDSVIEYQEPLIERVTWETLFENEDFKIVGKPPGWICSEASCQKTFGKNLFLSHRLDRDTTGALVLAKNKEALGAIEELFAKRLVHKTYLALVDGIVSKEEGTKNSFLTKKRTFQGQTIYGSSNRGDQAITHWKVVARGRLETLVRCYPFTGRTHQIRVHLSEMGHPILVDRQYASYFRSEVTASRPLLHAESISFSYKGVSIEAFSPPPSDFKKTLERICIHTSFKEI
jgi:RluA family pseudouridine synthase